jgi:1-acyl-sn-glycerol-3-phosphate acyltransferase
VFQIPVLGRIVAGAGQIPVYRETADAGKAFSIAVAAVRAGECVAIFREATLTRDPQLWPMVGKTDAARIALTTGCPVIPIAQWGAQDILAPYGRRLHLLPRRTVRVWAGPPVDLSAFAGSPLDADTLRGATDAILDRVTGMLAEIRGEQPPAQRWDPRRHGQPRIGDFHREAGGGL